MDSAMTEHSLSMGKFDPYGCWDGAIDDGVLRDEETDNILGILDFPEFPMEILEGDGFAGGDWDASKSQYLGPIPMDVLMGPPKIETGLPPPVSMHRPVTLIDTALESKPHSYNFDDAESSFIRRQHKSTEIHTFQSQSPVSVLESSASSLAGKSLLKPHITKRTRTKRARPSGTSPWLLIAPFLSTSKKTQEAKKTKERRKKLPNPPTEDSGNSGNSRNSSQPSDHASAQLRPTKKCTHCEITKTPQWREGPLGPKTLCNACGVRYRSGRLFPEYRPAASPTFVPSLHSNSHKKVVEMRSKGKRIEGSMSPQLEFVPVSSYLFDPIC